MTLDEWIDAACERLGLAGAVDPAAVIDLTLDLARDVAHEVERRAAPITAFLVGLAAGRADGDDPLAAASVYAANLRALLHVHQQGLAEGADGAVE